MASRRTALSLLLVVVCEVLFTTAYRVPPPHFIRLDEGFRAGKEYTYDYETTTMISLERHDDADQTSLVRLRTKARLTLLDSDLAIVRFEEPRLEKSDIDTTDPVRAKFSPVDDKAELNIREHLVKPVAFRFEDHATISQVKVESSDPIWSINLKKAFVQLFQLDLTGRRPAAAAEVKPEERQREREQQHDSIYRRVAEAEPRRHVYNVVEESVLGKCDTVYVVRDAKEDKKAVTAWSSISATETTDLPLFHVHKSRNSSTCIDMPKFNVSNITPEVKSSLPKSNEPTRHSSVVEYVLAGSRRDYVVVKAEVNSQIVLRLPIATKPMSTPKPNADVVVDSWSRLKLVKVERIAVEDKKTQGPVDARTLRSPLRLESPELERVAPDMYNSRPSSSSPVDEISQAGTITASNEEAIAREEKWRMDKLKDAAAKFCQRKDNKEHAKAAVSILEAVRAVRKIRAERLSSLINDMPCPEIRMPLVEAFVIENKPQTIEAVIRLVHEAKLSIKEVKTILNYISLSAMPKTSEISKLKTLCDEFESTKPMRFRRPDETESRRETVTDELPDDERWSLKKRCYLAYSNVIGNVCAQKTQRPDWAQLKTVRCDAEKFAEELRQLLRSAKSPREEYLALTAVSNTGLPQLLPELSAIISDRANLRHSEAIYALRLIASQPESRQQVRDLLMPVFLDSRVPEDVRIAAYIVLMSTRPSLPVISIVANSISNETSANVASFVYSHLSAIANSTQTSPLDAEVAAHVKKMIDRPTTPDAFSKYLEYGTYSDKLHAGASVVASLGARRSVGPNNAFARLNVDILGNILSPIEIAAAVRPMHQHDVPEQMRSDKSEIKEEREELLVRRILETVGVQRFFDSFGPRSETDKKTDINKSQEDIDLTNYRDISISPLSESREPITGYRAHYYVKVFGKIISFEHSEISELKALANKVVLRLLRGEKSEEKKTYANLLAKSELVLPTDSGIYVSLSTALATVVSTHRKAEINVLSKNVIASLHPIVGVAGEMRANIELPFLRAGIATNAKLRLELPLNAKVDLIEDGIKIKIDPYGSEYDMVKASLNTVVFEEPLLRDGTFKPTDERRSASEEERKRTIEDEHQRDFEPEKIRTVEYRREKSICSSPSRCAMKRMTKAWSMPFLGCRMVAEGTYNDRTPLSGPMRFRLTQRKSASEPLEIKIAFKSMEDVSAADIIERLEKLTNIKLSDKDHMNSLLDRKERYSMEVDDEDKRESSYETDRRRDANEQSSFNRLTKLSSSSEDEEKPTEYRTERAKIAKKIEDLDMNEIRNKYISDDKVSVKEVQVEAKVADRKSKIVVSWAKSPRHVHIRTYVEAALAETYKALWETIVPIEKDFGNVARSIEAADLSFVKDLRSHHLLRYGKNLERRVAIQINAHDVDADESTIEQREQDQTSDSYLKVEERHSNGQQYKRAITSDVVSTYKSALENVPELIRTFKRCIAENKYGYDKCRDTKAEYVYKCLSKHVEDAERSPAAATVDDDKTREELRQEAVVKVDRCITEKFIEKLYLRHVSVFVSYDRIPRTTSEVLPQLLNIFGISRNGHFEPAVYSAKPGHVLAKLHWSEDRETMDAAVYSPKFSYKTYGIKSLLPPPNRVYGYSPISSSVAAYVQTKMSPVANVVRPSCKLTVPYSVIAGKESTDKHSLKTFDGAKFEVTIPRRADRTLTILAASCNTKPTNVFAPRHSENEPTTLWVAIERAVKRSEEPASSSSRKVVIRVDENVYRVDAQCKATVSSVRDEATGIAASRPLPEAESIRRHIVPSTIRTREEDILATSEPSSTTSTTPSKDAIKLYRYEDGDCLIRERSTGIEVKFDGHSVKVSVSPLRTGFDSPLCGLCGDLNADLWAKERENSQVRRVRAELAVARNCPVRSYDASVATADRQSRREYEDDESSDEEYNIKAADEVDERRRNCDVVYKTIVEIKQDSNRICFSREAMPACPTKCRPTETRAESTAMTCIEDTTENRDFARRVMQSKEALNYGMSRLYAYPVMVNEMRNVPTRCERND